MSSTLKVAVPAPAAGAPVVAGSAARPFMSVVIPVHNEQANVRPNVEPMLEQLRAVTPSLEIILVENGSTDDTRAVIEGLAAGCSQIRLLTMPVADYGAALRAGMEATNGDVIACFDIDYWDVPFVRDATMLVQHRFDIVIGSKNLRLSSDRRTLVRRGVSQGFRFALNFGFGLRVSDTHGIKVWKRSATLRQLMQHVRFTHSLFDTELILRAQRAGLRIVELPVEVAETRRSSWKLLRRVPRTALELVALRALLWHERNRHS
jgi:glycosyltransferase involved in cell wall biosynthesis